MKNYSINPVGRPTTVKVSVLDNKTNSIIYTGSVSDFVNENFQYCSKKAIKTAKAQMYVSANKGCSIFGGKLRVFYNTEI
jgi:hypothetical protein